MEYSNSILPIWRAIGSSWILINNHFSSGGGSLHLLLLLYALAHCISLFFILEVFLQQLLLVPHQQLFPLMVVEWVWSCCLLVFFDVAVQWVVVRWPLPYF